MRTIPESQLPVDRTEHQRAARKWTVRTQETCTRLAILLLVTVANYGILPVRVRVLAFIRKLVTGSVVLLQTSDEP